MKIPDDVAEYIAGKVKANIREIEGALTTLYALVGTASRKSPRNFVRIALGR